MKTSYLTHDSCTRMFRFSIDRGGTFTDVYAECPDGSVQVMKLLSEDPDNYPDAPREAIRRIMQEVSSPAPHQVSIDLHLQKKASETPILCD